MFIRPKYSTFSSLTAGQSPPNSVIDSDEEPRNEMLLFLDTMPSRYSMPLVKPVFRSRNTEIEPLEHPWQSPIDDAYNARLNLELEEDEEFADFPAPTYDRLPMYNMDVGSLRRRDFPDFNAFAIAVANRNREYSDFARGLEVVRSVHRSLIRAIIERKPVAITLKKPYYGLPANKMLIVRPAMLTTTRLIAFEFNPRKPEMEARWFSVFANNIRHTDVYEALPFMTGRQRFIINQLHIPNHIARTWFLNEPFVCIYLEKPRIYHSEYKPEKYVSSDYSNDSSDSSDSDDHDDHDGKDTTKTKNMTEDNWQMTLPSASFIEMTDF